MYYNVHTMYHTLFLLTCFIYLIHKYQKYISQKIINNYSFNLIINNMSFLKYYYGLNYIIFTSFLFKKYIERLENRRSRRLKHGEQG